MKIWRKTIFHQELIYNLQQFKAVSWQNTFNKLYITQYFLIKCQIYQAYCWERSRYFSLQEYNILTLYQNVTEIVCPSFGMDSTWCHLKIKYIKQWTSFHLQNNDTLYTWKDGFNWWPSIIRIMVFNATFNNISFILWRSDLLVEETEENYSPAVSHW